MRARAARRDETSAETFRSPRQFVVTDVSLAPSALAEGEHAERQEQQGQQQDMAGGRREDHHRNRKANRKNTHQQTPPRLAWTRLSLCCPGGSGRNSSRPANPAEPLKRNGRCAWQESNLRKVSRQRRHWLPEPRTSGQEAKEGSDLPQTKSPPASAAVSKMRASFQSPESTRTPVL